MTLRNEFGAAGYTEVNSSQLRACYQAQATDELPETIQQLYDRCSQFMQRHGVKLGEGILHIYDELDPNWPISFCISAPQLEGPTSYFTANAEPE